MTQAKPPRGARHRPRVAAQTEFTRAVVVVPGVAVLEAKTHDAMGDVAWIRVAAGTEDEMVWAAHRSR